MRNKLIESINVIKTYMPLDIELSFDYLKIKIEKFINKIENTRDLKKTTSFNIFSLKLSNFCLALIVVSFIIYQYFSMSFNSTISSINNNSLFTILFHGFTTSVVAKNIFHLLSTSILSTKDANIKIGESNIANLLSLTFHISDISDTFDYQSIFNDIQTNFLKYDMCRGVDNPEYILIAKLCEDYNGLKYSPKFNNPLINYAPLNFREFQNLKIDLPYVSGSFNSSDILSFSLYHSLLSKQLIYLFNASKMISASGTVFPIDNIISIANQTFNRLLYLEEFILNYIVL